MLVEKIAQVVVCLFLFFDLGLELRIDGDQLLVEGLELFPGGLQFFVGCLEFFVRGMQFFVEAFQLFDVALEVFPRCRKLVFELADRCLFDSSGLQERCVRLLRAVRPSPRI